MRIHKEGKNSILIGTSVAALLIYAIQELMPENLYLLGSLLNIIIAAILFLIVYFFRIPNRKFTFDDNAIIAPADGKVVVIEEVFEDECLQKKCRQISIFMSPVNVHVNRYPVSGTVKYSKYHPGKYLVAWHPKSSTENERTTVVVETENKEQILFRQIAGALARRIKCYAKPNTPICQTDEFGFIKFGSRVDIFIPLDYVVKVNIGEKTQGGTTIIASRS